MEKTEVASTKVVKLDLLAEQRNTWLNMVVVVSVLGVWCYQNILG